MVATDLTSAEPIIDKIQALTNERIITLEKWYNIAGKDGKEHQRLQMKLASLKSQIAALKESIEYVRLKTFLYVSKEYLNKESWESIWQKVDSLLDTTDNFKHLTPQAMNQLSKNVKALFFSNYLGQEVEYEIILGDTPELRIDKLCGIDLYGTYKIDEIHENDFDENGAVLLLRKVEQLTDEEAIQIAQFAHQMPASNFKVKRDDDHIHVENTSGLGIIHHISIYKSYGTINANIHFLKTETDSPASFKANIGETTISSKRPVPYIAICDYLRAKGFLLPFTFLQDGKPITITPEQIVEMGWVRIKE